MSQVDNVTGEVLTDEQRIKLQLQIIEEFKAQVDLIRMEEQDRINEILTPQIMAEIEEVKLEFAGKAETALEKIKVLEEVIKQACIDFGDTVKGDNIMVVYTKGRKGGWNNDALEGYAVDHPDILQFRKPNSKPGAYLK